jgi:adenylate cyclase
MPAKVLIVDDEAQIVALVSEFLKQRGFDVGSCSDSRQAIHQFESMRPDICLLDFRMPHCTGGDLLSAFKNIDSTSEIIFLTAEPDPLLAIGLMKQGAIDYLLKPVSLAQLDVAISRALEHRTLIQQNTAYKLRLEQMLKEETNAHRLLRTLFGRYVSEDVATELITNAARHQHLRGDRREVTILFADLRGFTALAERLDPLDAVEILNSCLACMIEPVFQFSGTLDKFLGDGLMAVFGAPVPCEDHALRALHAAAAMNACLQEVRFKGLPELRMEIGIGINTGIVTAGTIGSEKRLDYTVIGDAVNVASRFESIAKPHQIIFGEKTFSQVRNLVQARSLGLLEVRGRSEPINAFELIGFYETVFAPNHNLALTIKT